MNVRRLSLVSLLAAALLLASVLPGMAQAPDPPGSSAPASPTGTTFTFQGQLKKDGELVDATCSMTFRLYDSASGGSMVGGPTTLGVAVAGGLFGVKLDFGAAFSGDARWLAILVQCPDDVAPVDMGRQQLTAAPYALYALGAPWSGLTGVPAGFADGVDNTSGGNDHDHWGQSWSGTGTGLTLSGGTVGLSASGSSSGLQGYGGAASGSGVVGSGYIGVQGSSASTSGRGLYGSATATTGQTYGVLGQNWSSAGMGVSGEALATSGDAIGVAGYTTSTSGSGVYGWANAASGTTYGVYGQSSSDDGRGVYGYAGHASGATYGVYGEAVSPYGVGVYGLGVTVGMQAKSTGCPGTGVYVEVGSAGDHCGTTEAIWARNYSDHGAGIVSEGAERGVRAGATALSGEAYGIYGSSASTSGTGVYGYVTAASGQTAGVSGKSDSTSGKGVVGDATATSGTTYGVIGYSASASGYAGYFRNTSSGPALWGLTDSGSGNIIELRSSFSDIEFRVSRDGNAYADGSFSGGGADYAELLPAEPGLAPGDVLVIGAGGRLERSSGALQTGVAGVYSTEPGFVAAVEYDSAGYDGAENHAAAPGGRVPLAVMGVVPVKASAENGSIRPGDLLTSANTSGRAMRAGDDPPPGTVIGKALEPLAKGQASIRMLVMLR